MKNVTQNAERAKAISHASRNLGCTAKRRIEAKGLTACDRPGLIGIFSFIRKYQKAVIKAAAPSAGTIPAA